MLGWIKLLGQQVRRNSSDDPDEFRLSLVEHLEELRTCIIRCAWVLMLLWIVIAAFNFDGFLVKKVISQVKLLVPKGTSVDFVFPHLVAPFMVHMRLSFQLALVIAAPFLVLQLWSFVAPGLKASERAPLQKIAPFTVLLFATGVFFCWQILPAAYGWFLGYVPDYGEAKLMQDISMLVNFRFMMLLAFGLGFQLPVLTWVLSKVGVITPTFIKRSWRQLSVGIFILSAVLTPSNDIFSMLMMAVPLTGMFAATAGVILLNAKNAPRDPLLDDLD